MSTPPLRLWLRESVDGPPLSGNRLLDRAWRSRGLSGAPDRGLKGLLHPSGLPDMARASERLADAVVKGERILVVSDYDVDGVTGAATMVSGLRAMGALAGFRLPSRAREGYGLTPEFARRVNQDAADVVVTVDSGISAFEGAALVSGVSDLIVTDHHLPAADGRLPAAFAVVNPQRGDSSFASKALCGCGVAFYLIAGVRRALVGRGHGPARDFDVKTLLDLVALATVADVVPLDENNRRLVSAGLARIRRGECRLGIRALAQVAGKELIRLTESDFGFALGPRINAAGRLDDATAGVRLLLSEDGGQCLEIADRLDRVNTSRREIERGILDEAFRQAEASGLDWTHVLSHPGWHDGVVGIVASRVRERFGRPAFCFALGSGGMMKGSGRSVPGFHLKHALDAIAHDAPGLIPGYGGHAMAAGMGIREGDLAEFAWRLDAEVAKSLTQTGLDGGEVVDLMGLESADYSLETAQALREGGPWGAAFEQPMYADDFRIADRRVLKEAHLKLAVVPERADWSGAPLEMIDFGRYRSRSQDDGLEVGASVRGVFNFDVNHYRGRDRLQLLAAMVEDRDADWEVAPLSEREALTLRSGGPER